MSNIFDEDWRDCLRAHYAHVIRERDTRNEVSLITVLKQTGFTEAEIDAMRTQTLIALGWYSPDQVDVPVEAIAESASVEPLTEVITEVSAEVSAEPPTEATSAPETEKPTAIENTETADMGEAPKPPAGPVRKPIGDKPPDNKPPKPPVQMSMF